MRIIAISHLLQNSACRHVGRMGVMNVWDEPVVKKNRLLLQLLSVWTKVIKLCPIALAFSNCVQIRIDISPIHGFIGPYWILYDACGYTWMSVMLLGNDHHSFCALSHRHMKWSRTAAMLENSLNFHLEQDQEELREEHRHLDQVIARVELSLLSRILAQTLMLWICLYASVNMPSMFAQI